MKTKTFVVTITSPYESQLTERNIRNILSRAQNCIGAVQVHEVNKTHTCDGCGKERRDVKACGKDANGDPDAPDLCFVCRKEASRGRSWNHKLGKYMHVSASLELPFG